MSTVDFVLTLLACICFGVAAFQITVARVHAGWLGALLLALTLVVP